MEKKLLAYQETPGNATDKYYIFEYLNSELGSVLPFWASIPACSESKKLKAMKRARKIAKRMQCKVRVIRIDP